MEFAVVAFPKLECADLVESVRRRFDPLVGLLAPHVTVVFPFASDGAEQSLERHVAGVVADVSPFDIVVEPPIQGDDHYLLMELSRGAERFVDMHDRLYSGFLAEHRSTVHQYRPHVTVGHLSPSENIGAALGEARDILPSPLRGRVDAVAVFRLDTPWRGEVVFTLPLGARTR